MKAVMTSIIPNIKTLQANFRNRNFLISTLLTR
jgi:hypothetical protein